KRFRATSAEPILVFSVVLPGLAAKLSPAIVGKPQPIDDVPAEREPGDSRYSCGSDHLVAQPQAQPGFRRKNPRQNARRLAAWRRRTLVTGFHNSQRLRRGARRPCQLTSQNISTYHRECRALPRYQRHAIRSITNERDPAL